ncbi:FKBP-type peptidyl-prolyl cis-trans isomerase [Streptomyces sp. MST-110588]|uniref:FKBP-type peptidyl-prolyl cis-trans isomerase n=1 Tax=Streptomyces sp. MST-110588 TaxID=2833628 RepID=UPI001F5D2AC1|nr:FKBP-type peptidyl-prolyl cis-trans isomerase [Streptomyces sp. MST-110588]UNO39141.1 FKBP-type peptidyl-prolyl cis-trans isomerase [Streptomyces sp. MST-110588]
MRRTAALLAVPLLLVSAAACGSEDSSSSTPGGIPAVSGGNAKKPVIDKGEGDPPKKLLTKVLKEGSGPVVEKTDLLTAKYVGQTWQGQIFDDNSWKKGEPVAFQIGVNAVVKGWDEGLVGKKVGSRVELVIPPDKGYRDQAQENIPANSTLVFVVDLEKTTSIRPKGKKAQQDAALPQVATDTDGNKAPKITVPKGKDAPTEIVAKPVIEGTGKEVTEKNQIVTNYTGVLWKDGKLFADTWQQNPQNPQMAPSPVTQSLDMLPGWKEALKGQKVGSRVLIVVPKEKLTKEQSKQIDSALVFSVDIIDVA